MVGEVAHSSGVMSSWIQPTHVLQIFINAHEFRVQLFKCWFFQEAIFCSFE